MRTTRAHTPAHGQDVLSGNTPRLREIADEQSRSRTSRHLPEATRLPPLTLRQSDTSRQRKGRRVPGVSYCKLDRKLAFLRGGVPKRQSVDRGTYCTSAMSSTYVASG